MSDTVSEILKAFEADTIPRAKILEWMQVSDLEGRGALYTKIVDGTFAKKINPSLKFEDYYSFVVPYLEQCIIENPNGDWSESRYIAGHQLASWISNWWKDKTISRNIFGEIKTRLATLYKNGDEGIRDGLLNGVLEHLLENRQLANYFKDWEDDSILKSVYEEALLWRRK